MDYMFNSFDDIESFENSKTKIESIEEHIKNIQTRVTDYNDAKFIKYVGTQLDEKLQRIIRDEEIKKLDSQKEKLEAKRGNIFNRLLGKDKEIELEIEQLTLRKTLLSSKAIHRRDSGSTHQLVARILQHKDENGVLPEKLAVMEQQIRSVFKINDDEVKAQLMDMTQPVSLVPVKQEKSTIFNRKARMEKLREENQALRQDIQNAEMNGMKEYEVDLEDESILDTPDHINQDLNRIHSIIENISRQNAKEEEKAQYQME